MALNQAKYLWPSLKIIAKRAGARGRVVGARPRPGYSQSVLFDPDKKEVTLKAVYYGPPLSGKTTNLRQLKELLAKDGAGDLVTLDSASDRTLFFDVLPTFYQTAEDYRIKVKWFTVPGQVVHAATRRLVLAGADAIVFVADAHLEAASINNEYWHGMRQYLSQGGLKPERIPTIIQFNKCDMPGTRPQQEISALAQGSVEPIFCASAVDGRGVSDTARALLFMMLRNLDLMCNFGQRFGVVAEDFIDDLFGKQAHSAQELRDVAGKKL